MAKTKPYKAKTLSGAQSYARMLIKSRAKIVALLERYARERKLMAKLAADGPCLLNPLELATAKKLRNEILRNECRLNPDGTPLK